eukprot:1061213-Lingulodinium_polyedra.AAC.1
MEAPHDLVGKSEQLFVSGADPNGGGASIDQVMVCGTYTMADTLHHGRPMWFKADGTYLFFWDG